jgi:hypothetical protein
MIPPVIFRKDTVLSQFLQASLFFINTDPKSIPCACGASRQKSPVNYTERCMVTTKLPSGALSAFNVPCLASFI